MSEFPSAFSQGRIMLTAAFAIPALACSAFVVYVEGVQPFALWNCGPMLLVVILAAAIDLTRKSARPRIVWANVAGLVGFSLPALAVTLYYHYAWLVDLNGIATSSSTSALLFVVLPFLAGAGGVGGAALFWISGFGLATLFTRQKRAPESRPLP